MSAPVLVCGSENWVLANQKYFKVSERIRVIRPKRSKTFGKNWGSTISMMEQSKMNVTGNTVQFIQRKICPELSKIIDQGEREI